MPIPAANAPRQRFYAEAAFYMELEDTLFQDMYRYLKDDLKVQSLIVGTSDHGPVVATFEV